MKQKLQLLQEHLAVYLQIRHNATDTFLLSVLKRRIAGLIRGLMQYDLSNVRKTIAMAIAIIGLNKATAQIFEPVQENPFGLPTSTQYASIPTFADIDNDGDLDLFVGGYYYEGLRFYENTGTATNPTFAAPVQNPFGFTPQYNLFHMVNFVDMDNDGDLDIIGSSYYYYAGTVAYYENTGTASSPVFGAPVSGIGGMAAVPYNLVMLPTVGDLDDDGDYDIMAVFYSYSYASNRIVYYENTGTASNPVFGTPFLDPFNLSGAVTYIAFPHLEDLDADGDLDLFLGQYGANGAISYIPNTGTSTTPSFGTQQFNPFNLSSVTFIAMPTAFGDIDGDGDVDMMVGEYDYYYGAQVNFFENGTINSIPEIAASEISIYPSPATSEISVELELLPESLEILDVSGKVVKTISVNSYRSVIDVTDLPSGSYMIRVTHEGLTGVKQFVKN